MMMRRNPDTTLFVLQVRVDSKLAKRFEAARDHRNISRAALMRLAMVDFLDRLDAEGRT